MKFIEIEDDAYSHVYAPTAGTEVPDMKIFKLTECVLPALEIEIPGSDPDSPEVFVMTKVLDIRKFAAALLLAATILEKGDSGNDS